MGMVSLLLVSATFIYNLFRYWRQHRPATKLKTLAFECILKSYRYIGNCYIMDVVYRYIKYVYLMQCII